MDGRTAAPPGERAHYRIDGVEQGGGARSPAGGKALAKRGQSPTQRGRDWLARQWAEEAEQGTGFVLLPVFMGLGALVYFGLGLEPHWLVAISAPVLSAVLLYVLRERPAPFCAALTLTMVLTGIAAGKIETLRADGEVSGSAVTTRVTGRVVRVEHQASGRIRLTLELLATERPQLRYAPARIRLSARGVEGAVAPGAIVHGYARLMPPSGPVRPGGYDFAFENYFDGLGASGFFLGDPEVTVEAGAAGAERSLAARIETLRLAIAERIRRHLDGAEAEIAATLMAGMRAGIPPESAEILRRTGLAHILAISGLHMALVAVTVMGSLRLVLALFPEFSQRHPVKKYAAGAALAACAFYLAISGMAVAAQRSFIMLSVMLVALLFDRAAITMRNLAIAALIVLAISPHEVVGPSFQMSFAATAVLIGAYGAWSRRRAARPRPAYRPYGPARRIFLKAGLFVIGLAATSILAGLATTLYGVHHFHRVSPQALGTNMTAMPIVTIAVMPLVVFSGIAMPFGLEEWPLRLLGSCIGWVLAIAQWFSDRSPIDAVGAIPPASVAVLSLAMIVAVLPVTMLRLAAIPLALVGFWLVAERRLPDVLVSEDGRLVAVRTADATLALNRARPNAFTLTNWLHALAAEEWTTPGASRPEDGRAHFVCDADTCIARHHSGALVAHVPDEQAAMSLCGNAGLIVIDDATAANPCPDQAMLVLTKRDLARRGSAAIVFGEAGGAITARLEHAIAEPYRPWHHHRRFSREARGLAPIERGRSARQGD